MVSSRRTSRAILDSDKARAIYKCKLSATSSYSAHASKLARNYGVSPKAIRDIWTGRTWQRVTYSLDPSNTACVTRIEKRLGRPRGAKDNKPRKPKHSSNMPSGPQRSLARTAQATIQAQETAGPGLIQADTSGQDVPTEWASFLAGGCLPFTDPFHNDYPFWPKEPGGSGTF